MCAKLFEKGDFFDMTPQEILNEFYKLPMVEKMEVLDSITEDLSAEEVEDLRLQKSLFAAGLLREIKSPGRRKIGDFEPISIQGKPLSETIIEERR